MKAMMKRIVYFLTTLLVLSSCGKSKLTTSERLIGRWKSDLILSQLGHMSYTIEFFKDGKFETSGKWIEMEKYSKLIDKPMKSLGIEGTYTIQGDVILLKAPNYLKTESYYFAGDELILGKDRLKKQ